MEIFPLTAPAAPARHTVLQTPFLLAGKLSRRSGVRLALLNWDSLLLGCGGRCCRSVNRRRRRMISRRQHEGVDGRE